MTDTQARSSLDLDFPTAKHQLLRSLAQNWWLLLLRGVAAIVFGILAFSWPGLTLLTLTLLWGAYTLSDGILALWAAITAKGVTRGRAGGSRWRVSSAVSPVS
jgi:uncharacterized membrane protein HdeD (DUF308 family)